MAGRLPQQPAGPSTTRGRAVRPYRTSRGYFGPRKGRFGLVGVINMAREITKIDGAAGRAVMHDNAATPGDGEALDAALRLLLVRRLLKPEMRGRERELRMEASDRVQAIARDYQARQEFRRASPTASEARRFAARVRRTLLAMIGSSPEAKLLFSMMARSDPIGGRRPPSAESVVRLIAHAAGLAAAAEQTIGRHARGRGPVADRIFGSPDLWLIRDTRRLVEDYWTHAPATEDGALVTLALAIRALAGDRRETSLRRPIAENRRNRAA